MCLQTIYKQLVVIFYCFYHRKERKKKFKFKKNTIFAKIFFTYIKGISILKVIYINVIFEINVFLKKLFIEFNDLLLLKFILYYMDIY